jgi:uncharacterized protein
MTSQSAVNDFLNQRTLAVVGVSRKGGKFGNLAYKELRARGYQLFPVHPQAEKIEGDRAYPSLRALPGPVGGVLVVVPPAQTEQVVRDAASAGIKRVWMQQGADSPAAVRTCAENGISEIHGECVLMFAKPVEKHHRFHRWLWRMLGKLPK